MNKVASDQEVKSSVVINGPLNTGLITGQSDLEDNSLADDIKLKTYTCSSCKVQFFSYSTLWRHIKRAHNKDKLLPCETCGKEFLHKSQLDIHTAIHTGETHFTCETCFKGFYALSNLKSHLRSAHRDEKIHECCVCGKGFKHKHGLKYHLRIHTGEKPYACHLCDKKFNEGNALKYHVNYSHENENKVFECDKCDKVFAEKYRLDYHVRAHHQALK